MKNQMKNTFKLGIGSIAGMGVMGAMSNINGMPKESGTVSNIASSGLVLANVGQLGKTGLGLAKSLNTTTNKSHKHHKVVKNILGL